MLLGTLDATLLGNVLTGRGINRVGKGGGINRAGEGVEELVMETKWIFNTASSFN